MPYFYLKTDEVLAPIPGAHHIEEAYAMVMPEQYPNIVELDEPPKTVFIGDDKRRNSIREIFGL